MIVNIVLYIMALHYCISQFVSFYEEVLCIPVIMWDFLLMTSTSTRDTLFADISCLFTFSIVDVMNYKELVNRLLCVRPTGRILTVIWL